MAAIGAWGTLNTGGPTARTHCALSAAWSPMCRSPCGCLLFFRLRPQRLPRLVHPCLDLSRRPSREDREVPPLLLISHRQRLAIGVGSGARSSPFPGVAQHVPSLKVFAVARLKERDVFRKVRGIIAHVQARDVGACAHSTAVGQVLIVTD